MKIINVQVTKNNKQMKNMSVPFILFSETISPHGLI